MPQNVTRTPPPPSSPPSSVWTAASGAGQRLLVAARLRTRPHAPRERELARAARAVRGEHLQPRFRSLNPSPRPLEAPAAAAAQVPSLPPPRPRRSTPRRGPRTRCTWSRLERGFGGGRRLADGRVCGMEDMRCVWLLQRAHLLPSWNPVGPIPPGARPASTALVDPYTSGPRSRSGRGECSEDSRKRPPRLGSQIVLKLGHANPLLLLLKVARHHPLLCARVDHVARSHHRLLGHSP